MADQSNQLSYQVREAAGHAQARREEVVEKTHDAASAAQEATRQGARQAGGLVQQAAAQVQQISQGAADTVKNATGLGGN